MLFNTFEFVIFFLITIVLYYLLEHKYRWILLLLVSYYFYYSWEPKLVLLLLASTIIDYFCGIKIHESKNILERKIYLFVSIGTNIGLLIFFKYLSFITQTTLGIAHFFGIKAPEIDQVTSTYGFYKILIPIGISFYTFQTLSYSIEIYRKNLQPERHLGRYALYVSFFPQLVAGPIERAQEFLPQLKNKISLNVNTIKIGFMLMAWGYFMKMVVADRLGVYVDMVFNNPASYPGIPLIIGAYFFTFQVYFDFAAYSIIAIGAARVMGFNLMTNFDRPLFEASAGELWSKWHMSLMSWFRDYLYRPLVKTLHLKRYIALLIVFALSGLWHGSSWNFLLWGFLNGMFVLFERATRKSRKKIVNQASRFIPLFVCKLTWWLIYFHFIVFTLILFRSVTLIDAFEYMRHIPKIHSLKISVLSSYFELFLSFFFIIVVQIIHYFKPDDKVYELLVHKNVFVRWSLYIIFIFVIVFFSVVRNNPFIYFQF